MLEVFPQLKRMLVRRAGKLSGGERKMLAMGRALMLEPVLVVLDEPTANPRALIARSVLQEHVRQLASTGASVLVVEQRAKAVLEISDRTYVLGGGQLRMEGTPAELAASSEFVDSFFLGEARCSTRPGRAAAPRASPAARPAASTGRNDRLRPRWSLRCLTS